MTPRTTPLLLVAGLLAVAPSAAAQRLQIRSIDGSGNNLTRPGMGAAATPLARWTRLSYDDGLSSPGGVHRPGARSVSNNVAFQSGSVPNHLPITDFVWQWGQFLDHDIDLTPGAEPAEPFDVSVPRGDPWFDPAGNGGATIPLDRSTHVTDGNGVRQQRNMITAWIDASNVYGSDDARAMELRALDGTGKLKVSAHGTGDMLPFNVKGLPNAPTAHDPSLFLGGDVRANEQIGLTAMHTLFVREHNWLCDQIAILLPWTGDELRYQLARMVVAAEMQHVTFEEFLPVLLGPGAIDPYTGYDPTVDASIANLFSTASYRFGHSMLSPTLLRRDAAGDPIAAGDVELRDAFFNPSQILNNDGIEPILRGLAMQRPQEIDALVIDDVRNFLFGPPGAGGFDLVSLNVQRGRDHGLPSYAHARKDLGLTPVTTFSQISSNLHTQLRLARAYSGHPALIDAWVGGLAEDHMPGALVGPLFYASLTDQFQRLRDGDRHWYEISLPRSLLRFVKVQTLARIIRRNTSIGSELPDDVFHL